MWDSNPPEVGSPSSWSGSLPFLQILVSERQRLEGPGNTFVSRSKCGQGRKHSFELISGDSSHTVT